MIQLLIGFAPVARRDLFPIPRLLTYGIVACFLVLGLSAAGQVSGENEKRCAEPAEDPDLRIAACTALILSPQMTSDDLATAYNDRGNGYKDNGDFDRAIQDYAQAIRLRPNDALAFYNRGNACSSKGKYNLAVQDYGRAIRLNPHGAYGFYAFYGRGYAYSAEGDYDRAIQDYDQALRLNPEDANAFILRGIANFLRANFPRAVADFQRGNELNPEIAYSVLWLDLARRRLGQDDATDLAERAAKSDSVQWPAPIVKFYLGQMRLDQMMAAASADADTQKSRLCEANFFAGEDALLQQRRSAARALFQAALAGCPKTNLHYNAAAAELKRVSDPDSSGSAVSPAR